MARLVQKAHPRGISKTTIRNNYPRKKISLSVNRRTKIRVKKV